MSSKIKLTKEKIEDFCLRWKIKEMSLFGSVLREDFGPESDVDILVSFHEIARWSLFDWVDMIEELKEIHHPAEHTRIVFRLILRNLQQYLIVYGANNPGVFRGQSIITSHITAFIRSAPVPWQGVLKS